MRGSWTKEINCMVYFKKETGLEKEKKERKEKKKKSSISLLKFRMKSFCSSYFCVVGPSIVSSYTMGWQVVNQTNAYK